MYKLRELERKDLPEINKWRNDPKLIESLGAPFRYINLNVDEKWFDNYMSNRSNTVRCAIVTESDDNIIGRVTIASINNINRTATLGIFIGDKDYRDKGYGTEAIKLILEYGFKYMNLNNIKLDLMAFNTRALKCYEKCGFKEYGRRRNCKFVNGKYYDAISMDILAEEFQGDYIRNKNI